MEIIAGKMDWLATDEQNLAAFLETPTGQRFIPKLLEDAPMLLEQGDTNQLLIRSGLVLGYQKVAQTILMLAHPPAKMNQEAAVVDLPPLENDALWPKPPTEPALEFVEPTIPAQELETEPPTL